MFKRMLLALTFVAALTAGSLGVTQTAQARWGYYYRPYVVAPRAYYYGAGTPYRTYYYGPRYYSPGAYYYPEQPRYSYGYPDYYYYGPNRGVNFGIRL